MTKHVLLCSSFQQVLWYVQINILKVHVQYTWVHWIIGIIIKLTIVNTNTCIVTLYFIHGTCSLLEILFKSISNHHWSLRKMKVNRPVYDMEFRQFPCWDGHVQILCLFNCLALFYKHAFAFQPLLNFEKRLFKLDSSTEVRNFEIIVSISVFRCFIVDSNIVLYPAFSWQDVTFVININWFRFP